MFLFQLHFIQIANDSGIKDSIMQIVHHVMREVYSGEFIKLIMYLTFENWWTLHVCNCLNLDQVMQFGGGIVNPLRCGEILMCTGKWV